VKQLSKNRIFENITFYVNKGEILGFFGLVGARRTDVVRAIFGADEVTSGEIYIRGKKVELHSPSDAILKGIGLIPEERKLQGFIRYLNNTDNIALPGLKKFARFLFINYKRKRENAVNFIRLVGLRPADPYFVTSNLSGGNQQKAVLAKWLSTGSDIMIFDEPTKGIDVGAKNEIYNLMEDLVEKGRSIIMISSELTEVIGMSDRLMIMKDGRIVAEKLRMEFNEKDILSFALEGATQLAT
jgi:ABC-type sugar transport system ATPase subunit